MRTSIIFILVLISGSTVCSQDIKTAEAYFTGKEYGKAKTAIDNAVDGNFKNDPKAWLWKHKIYQTLGLAAKPAAATAVLQAGFEAMKKAMAMPKGDEAAVLILGLKANEDFNTYYTTFINNGSVLMNAADNAGALLNFKNALAVSGYFYEQKIISTQLDTMLTFYAGYTAMKAEKPAEAVYYFKKLADAGASGTDLQIGYGWLCNYYLTDLKDITTARLYCDMGLKLYPDDEYLRSKKTDIERAGGNMNAVFKNFEDIIASGKATFSDYLGYAAELYDYLYVDKKSGAAEKSTKQARLFDLLNKAYAIKSNSPVTSYLLGMSYTSKALELDADVKNPSIDEAQKEPLKKERDLCVEKSITYLENASTLYAGKATLTESEKEYYKTSLQQLVNLYKFTKNVTKQTETEVKIKGL